MLLALVENGPLAVAYAVYDDFGNYEGGIYHHTSEKNEFNPLEVSEKLKSQIQTVRNTALKIWVKSKATEVRCMQN